jgi:hypothetical protein
LTPYQREKVKEAQAALLAKLAKEHKAEMTELNTGKDKVEADSPLGKLLAKTASAAAKGFEG